MRNDMKYQCPNCHDVVESLSSCVDCAKICCVKCFTYHLLEHNCIISLTDTELVEFKIE